MNSSSHPLIDFLNEMEKEIIHEIIIYFWQMNLAIFEEKTRIGILRCVLKMEQQKPNGNRSSVFQVGFVHCWKYKLISRKPGVVGSL